MKVLYTKIIAGICIIAIGRVVYETLGLNGYIVGIAAGILCKLSDSFIDDYYFRKLQ